ncbi:MAG TPA: glycosyltransferase [Flavobacteriales bacterium]|nr:glycosyltransferase [Flavobacteriales bacterium]
MKKVLIIGQSEIKIDPRVHRQVIGLLNHCEVHILGPDPFPDARVYFHDINVKVEDDRSILAKIKRLGPYLFDNFKYKYFRNPSYSHNVEKLKKIDFDLIINNEVFTLPLAEAIRGKKSKVHWDAHEYYYSYYADQLQHENKNKYINFLLNRYVPKLDSFSTVCDGIADLYKNKFNRPVATLENLPVKTDINPSKINGRIKLVHHGAGLRDRKLENMFELMKFLSPDKFEFHIYLTNNQPEYMKELKSTYDFEHVFFHDPVPMTEIVNEINQYDIGICIVPHTNENYRFGLPNKFFEFIQARLMIIVNEGEEMPKIVRKHNLGLVVNSQDPKEIAEIVSQLTPETIDRFKKASHDQAAFFSATKIYSYYKTMIGVN